MSTLTAFLKENNTKLKEIKKLTVRDLDQLEPNLFVAYVDQKDKSYDVQIRLNSKKQIETTSCDCSDGAICIHMVALADFLKNQTKTTETSKKRILKKQSESDQLLEAISDLDLRIWIADLLNTNKEIAFVFKNKFSKEEIQISEEKLTAVINESIKSIIGKRKTVQTNEVKKIIDTLQISLKPYTDALLQNQTLENLKHINYIAKELWQFYDDYYLNTTRIGTFINKIKETFITNLLLLKDFDLWCERVEDLIAFEITDEKHTHFFYTDKIYKFSKTNELKLAFFLNKLEEKTKPFLEKKENWSLENFHLKAFVLPIYIEQGMFAKYVKIFKPVKFQNDYNLLLIQALKELGENEKVEKYALDQIANNYYYEEFNIPYVKILDELYRKLEQNDKLALLLARHGKYIFSLNNYELIKKYAPSEDFKKYRQALLTNATNAIVSGNLEAFELYYQLKKDEGKQDFLFDILNKTNSYTIFNQYKEDAFKMSEMKFLKALCNIRNSSLYEKKEVNEIVQFITKNYDEKQLEFYLKQFRGFNEVLKVLWKNY
ncbi:SWIM zinc finger family protein [Flavobacterium davisii]|uniref:SWIM zinc finger family protein n=1 Tax=Flavobacterium columnare TaxID=996 RepID=A0A8G0KVD4_9FLAO|nr:SWIM zinc finger family protein [Flavobacterium davisii]QYS88459.1 SWIM zinc finger family protein [Flavobacterium davisii]